MKHKKTTVSLPINDPDSFNNLEDIMFMELLNSKFNTPEEYKALKDKWVNIIIKSIETNET